VIQKKYYLDLSVDCKIKKTNTKIYIIFEHKSYHDRLTLIQTLNYCLTIWENEIENRHIVVNKDIKKEELKEIIDEVKGGDKIMTLAQRWLEEGKQEGIQIGMQQGIQTGIFETAIIMMEKLNHSIDEIVKVLNIKKEELIEYIDRKAKSK